MDDFDLEIIENSADTEQNYESNETFKTGTTDRIGEIEQLDMTDVEFEANKIDEESDKNEENLNAKNFYKIDKQHRLHRFFTAFNECFTFPRTYIFTHVNINTDLISRVDSEKRVFWLMSFLAFLLSFTIAILVSIIFSLFMKSSVKPQMTMPDHELEGLPVVQKLVVVLGDGTTLMLAMNKSLELNIVEYHKFNYDKNGFFAYDQIDHIQTLVGSPGKLNLMHDYRFNSKKIPGKSKSDLYVLYQLKPTIS